MKKFEIVNNKWIKELALGEYGLSSAIKISSISHITSSSIDGGKTSSISLYIESHRIEFKYGITEQTEYKDDLAFLEKLLF
jgi:hypothetical protein